MRDKINEHQLRYKKPFWIIEHSGSLRFIVLAMLLTFAFQNSGIAQLPNENDRIGWSSDGNLADEDDWAATPLALAIFAKMGWQEKLVHFDYNNRLDRSLEWKEAENYESTIGGAKRFGFNLDVFFDDQRELEAAIENAKEEINKSHEGSKFWYVQAGPFEVAYQALLRATPEKRQYCILVSHSEVNEKPNKWKLKDGSPSHGMEDCVELGATYFFTTNQYMEKFGGKRFKRWDLVEWLKNSPSEEYRWLHSRFEETAKHKDGGLDASDGGMAFVLATGDLNGNFSPKLKDFLQGENKSTYPSGDAEIDKFRQEVKTNKTTEANYQERTKIMYMWMSALQQQGANTHPFYDLDLQYRKLESKINNPLQFGQALTKHDDKSSFQSQKGSKAYIEGVAQICKTIDAGFAKLEEIQKDLVDNGPIFKPFEATTAVKGGDMSAEWPMFQANKHNNGATTAPGPSYGREAWRFPVGLGWYARPVIEGDRIYVTSPGMRTSSFCLDLKTGTEIWKSTQSVPIFYLYKYPAMASTPLLINNQVVLREINSHGGNDGQARNLVYLNKETGEVEARRYAGHIDYRTRYAPVTGNEKYVVYPFGLHDIYGTPAICQNLNRLICSDSENKKKLWDFNVGDIDALAEPVISGEKVFQGTMDGYVYGLNLINKSGLPRIAWNFLAKGSVNSAVLIENNKVYFGSNGGSVYCLNEADGQMLWEFKVKKAETRARKHFTTPVMHNNKIYVGGADKYLYCLDADNGKPNWKVKVDDWVRASPVVTENQIFFATISGQLYSVNHKGEVNWQKKISTHAVYADLVSNGDELLITDSNLMLSCLNMEGKTIWNKSILTAFTKEAGERIFTDHISGGTYYQSKPTAANGNVVFGTPSGFLYSVDADTGEENWKFEMGGAISVGAALADGKVYAGQQGSERFFYCLDAETGELVWKQTIPGGWVWGSAAVDDGLVYVPTVSGYAVCLDGETGHIVWMFPTAKSVPAEPAIDGDLVYFGSWSHSLYAFNKKNGEIVWKNNGIGLDSGTLIAKDGKIYLPSARNIFTYFDAKTGKLLNEGNTNDEEKGVHSGFNASPAFDEGVAFFTARVGRGIGGVPMASRVYSVDPETAKINWTFPDGGGLSAPALASGRVYIASGNTPFLYCLDQKNGQPHWIFKLGHRVEESTLCIYRKMVYVLSADGYVHAIE